MKVRFSRLAREDLLEIWLYVARQNSETAADKVVDRIEEACKRLGAYPQLGPVRPEIAEDARALVIERWLALYRVVDGAAHVVRIVDGSRDLTKIDWASE